MNWVTPKIMLVLSILVIGGALGGMVVMNQRLHAEIAVETPAPATPAAPTTVTMAPAVPAGSQPATGFVPAPAPTGSFAPVTGSLVQGEYSAALASLLALIRQKDPSLSLSGTSENHRIGYAKAQIYGRGWTAEVIWYANAGNWDRMAQQRRAGMNSQRQVGNAVTYADYVANPFIIQNIYPAARAAAFLANLQQSLPAGSLIH